MRLVHLNADRGIGPERSKGAAVHLRAMREAFASLGVEVLCIDEPDERKVFAALERAHTAGGISMIYERLALGGFAGGEFARRHGLPHVLEINAPLDEEQARYRADAGRSVDAQRLRNLVQGAQLALCVSSACAEWARSRGAADERVLVAGNGVDVTRFHPARRDGALPHLALPEDAFVIGFHGRLRPWHGFERLVATTRALVERGLEPRLLMIGKGEFEEAIGDGLAREHWTHIPWVDHDEVGRYVARFDVLPLCYDPEQPCYFSPLKLLEGMAAGAVAVVPDLGDLAETIENGRAGVVYDARDPEALTTVLTELAEDPVRRHALAEEGRRVARGHSWSRIASLVLERLGTEVR